MITQPLLPIPPPVPIYRHRWASIFGAFVIALALLLVLLPPTALAAARTRTATDASSELRPLTRPGAISDGELPPVVHVPHSPVINVRREEGAKSGDGWGVLSTLNWAVREVAALTITIKPTSSTASAPAVIAPRNVLLFGPNGSGKGTQGALVAQQFPGMAHIESGAIFRQHALGNSQLGRLAKSYIDRGELVPDDITVPMMLEAMKAQSGKGWLLDGFPRNPTQAALLWESLVAEGIPLDVVIEIILPRNDAKKRIMGRRICATNPNHPNNIAIIDIDPRGPQCRVCGGALSARADDQDEATIDKRHDIYYSPQTGTLAAVAFYRRLAASGQIRFIQLDGTASITEVRQELMEGLRGL